MQTVHTQRFSCNLYWHCIRKPPTELQQDTFDFRFLQSIAIPIIFPPTWYLMSNEPYQYWKWTAIYQQTYDDSIALLLLSESAVSVAVHYTHETLTPSYTDGIVVFNHSERHWMNWGYMEQYNIIIVQVPEESLINKFTTGQRGGKRGKSTMRWSWQEAVWCYGFEGQRESALGTVGLIVQERRAWHQHVIIIHLAARIVSTP